LSAGIRASIHRTAVLKPDRILDSGAERGYQRALVRKAVIEVPQRSLDMTCWSIARDGCRLSASSFGARGELALDMSLAMRIRVTVSMGLFGYFDEVDRALRESAACPDRRTSYGCEKSRTPVRGDWGRLAVRALGKIVRGSAAARGVMAQNGPARPAGCGKALFRIAIHEDPAELTQASRKRGVFDRATRWLGLRRASCHVLRQEFRPPGFSSVSSDSRDRFFRRHRVMQQWRAGWLTSAYVFERLNGQQRNAPRIRQEVTYGGCARSPAPA